MKNFPEKIVLATGNVGKLKEINELFAAIPTDIAAQGEFGIESPEETGQTFMENALLKARYAVQQTGLPAIADDSGLSVDALDGRPGVRSARYAGEDATDAQNIDLLLKESSVPLQAVNLCASLMSEVDANAVIAGLPVLQKIK